MPSEDWAILLKTAKVDYNREEIKLPAADLTARVRATDLAEGPIRELLRDPTKVLLPSAEWPQPVPQAKVWVASDNFR